MDSQVLSHTVAFLCGISFAVISSIIFLMLWALDDIRNRRQAK